MNNNKNINNLDLLNYQVNMIIDVMNKQKEEKKNDDKLKKN